MTATRYLGENYWAEWNRGKIYLYRQINDTKRLPISHNELLGHTAAILELQRFVNHMYILLNFQTGSLC